MEITVESTPNPLAMKYTVGVPVGGPATWKSGNDAPAGLAPIIALPGVRSIFTTADFVTVSGDPDVNWDAIGPDIVACLDEMYG